MAEINTKVHVQSPRRSARIKGNNRHNLNEAGTSNNIIFQSSATTQKRKRTINKEDSSSSGNTNKPTDNEAKVRVQISRRLPRNRANSIESIEAGTCDNITIRPSVNIPNVIQETKHTTKVNKDNPTKNINKPKDNQIVLAKVLKIILKRIDADDKPASTDKNSKNESPATMNLSNAECISDVQTVKTRAQKRKRAEKKKESNPTENTNKTKDNQVISKEASNSTENVRIKQTPRRSARNMNDSQQNIGIMKKRASKRKPTKKKNLTLKERIDMEALDKCFVTNEVVLATVPGYPAWPARVVAINGSTITVEFFGTGERNPLRSHAISRFEYNKIIPLLERKGYKKAIRELEYVLGLPSEASIF